jgi:hypothetical protein
MPRRYSPLGCKRNGPLASCPPGDRIGMRWLLLFSQKGLDVLATTEHMKNKNVLLLNAVNDDVLAYRKTTKTGAQIVITASSNVRMACKKVETLSDGIDEPIGNLDAAALLRNVIQILPSSTSASGATR